ncbi:hypothetical protein DXG01_008965 [Tephrocybe rancida]|nr:hypothetical protein DXG01_008965 [Tephrocybe rancida]
MQHPHPPAVTEESVETSLITRLRDIFANALEYRHLLENKGQDAQDLLNIFQWLLDRSPTSTDIDAPFRRNLIVATQRLSSKTDLYPTCYELSSELRYKEDAVAAGGFADIYKGKLGKRVVCIKVLRIYQNTEKEDILKARPQHPRRFERETFSKEVMLWGQLLHPHILPIYGVYQFLEKPCLVMPWMKNGNVMHYLKANPSAPRIQIPNILITDDGRACLADFGISSISDSKIHAWTSHSSASSKGGTARWQAPELFNVEIDEQVPRNTRSSDVYAVACVFYEIFTGTVPFDYCPSDAAVIHQIMIGAQPSRPPDSSPSWTEQGLTEKIWRLMTDCWNRDSAKRPSIESVQRRLTPDDGLNHPSSLPSATMPSRERMGGPMSVTEVPPRMLCQLVPQAMSLMATTPRCVAKGVTLDMLTVLATTLTERFGPMSIFEAEFATEQAFIDFSIIDAARLSIGASPISISVDGETFKISIEPRLEESIPYLYDGRRLDRRNMGQTARRMFRKGFLNTA